MDQLQSPKSVVDALGGFEATRAVTGAKNDTNIHNWVARGSFPPRTYVAIQTELQRLGKSAPASLWRMIAPPVRQEAS